MEPGIPECSSIDVTVPQFSCEQRRLLWGLSVQQSPGVPGFVQSSHPLEPSPVIRLHVNPGNHPDQRHIFAQGVL